VTFSYQNYTTDTARKKSGRREFHHYQHYWKYQGMENTLVSYLAYVGDMITAYIITVTHYLWGIPMYGWFEFVLHMIWE